MSDDESPAVEPEPEPEVEVAKVAAAPPKRRDPPKADAPGLEEADKELLSNNREERSRMDDEIRELRDRNEKRKKEREIEEKRLAAERAGEDSRRKAEEEERKRKKEEDEMKRKGERAQKMAEFEKWKTPPKANFVISKRVAADGGEDAEQEEGEGKARKSKEQLETEKRAILKQRLKPLEIDGADNAKLSEKAKELHTLLSRLEGEKYDLEKRFKIMQVEMNSLAERARAANKVGKEGTVKRIDETMGGSNTTSNDKIMERYAGAPLKVEMFSKYERQKDKRTYDDRKVLYTGPQFGCPAERIKPQKQVGWTEEGLPVYGAGGSA
jgi:troponin T